MRAVVRGAGSIGSRHAEVLSGMGAEVLLWPVRPRPGQVEPDSGVYAGADLAVIATDTGRHVADARAALDAGAARVLVEKPAGPDAASLRALADHPRADAVWVAAPLRAHAGFRWAAEQVPELGGPLAAHVVCGSWLPDWRPGRDYRQTYAARPEEGGVLRDLIHEIDYAALLFGEPQVSASIAEAGPLEMPTEQAVTMLWAAPRATVTMRLDYVTRPTVRRLTVTGPEGGLVWDVPSATVTRTAPDGTRQTRTFAADLDRAIVMTTQARAALTLKPTADADRRRDAGAPATLAEGIAAVAICDEARRRFAAADPDRPPTPPDEVSP